jgi:hypothetical protein
MLGWEDTKRAAQGAYMSAGRGFQDMYSGIGSAYQQILTNGQLSPAMGYGDINQQIAQDAYQPTAADWQEYGRYRDAWERDNPDPRMTGPDQDAPEPEL